uniref:Uncharacterized protein n=1 Tax=Arundo donax TaxID=35708 RepID=A0A0A9DPN4_ARUDO
MVGWFSVWIFITAYCEILYLSSVSSISSLLIALSRHLLPLLYFLSLFVMNNPVQERGFGCCWSSCCWWRCRGNSVGEAVEQASWAMFLVVAL